MACVSPVGQVELDVPYDNWSCHFYLLRGCLQEGSPAGWSTGGLSQSCASCCQSRGVNAESIEGREWGTQCAGQGSHCIMLSLVFAEQPCSNAATSQGLHLHWVPLAALPTCAPSAERHKLGRSSVCQLCYVSVKRNGPWCFPVSRGIKWSFYWKAILAGRGFCHHAHGMAVCNSSWCQLRLQPSAAEPEELKGLPVSWGLW